jgi:ABC-type amino acid transport substrate-binding protein
MFRKIVMMALLVTLSIGTAFAAGQKEAEPTRPVKKVASNAQRIVQWYREGDGYAGYEYETIKEALNRAGYDMEVVDVAFAGIFAGLQAEKWDMAASNIFITKARYAEMDFTTPYHAGYDFVAALKDGPVQSPEDMAGKVVGAETGTSQAAFVASLMEKYGPFKISLYEDAETQWGDLQSGRIAALGTGGATFAVRQRQNPIYQVVIEAEDLFMVGAAMRKGDPFVEEFNAALNSMKEDRTTAELFEKYFLFPPPEGSPDITVFTEPHVPTR